MCYFSHETLNTIVYLPALFTHFFRNNHLLKQRKCLQYHTQTQAGWNKQQLSILTIYSCYSPDFSSSSSFIIYSRPILPAEQISVALAKSSPRAYMNSLIPSRCFSSSTLSRIASVDSLSNWPSALIYRQMSCFSEMNAMRKEW